MKHKKHLKTYVSRTYQETVVTNAQALCKNLKDLGYKIVTDGTDNHIVLVDLRNIKLSGSKAERILEDVGISVNKNTVPGDKSAMNPSGMFIYFLCVLKPFQNKKGQKKTTWLRLK